jgi:hypothetical protein
MNSFVTTRAPVAKMYFEHFTIERIVYVHIKSCSSDVKNETFLPALSFWPRWRLSDGYFKIIFHMFLTTRNGTNTHCTLTL